MTKKIDNNNGKNNYSKVEKSIADSSQHKDLSRMEKKTDTPQSKCRKVVILS
jgi:hypothetical protein